MFYPAYIHSDPDGSASGFFQALWKHIWSSVRRTLLAGNGCWWISI